MNHSQDFAEELRTKNEKLEIIVNEQKTQLDQQLRKEDSIIAQYQKMLDSLRQDMREIERQSQLSETRYLQSKQELLAKATEYELRIDLAE